MSLISTSIHRSVAVAALAASAWAMPAPAVAKAAAGGSGLGAEVTQLATRIDRLESTRALKKLQRAYGYYVDRGLWGEAADLFADNATLEYGLDGVYVGKARIMEYLRRQGGGQDGLRYGQLNEHVQLQPVVTISPDGDHAKARWRDLGMTGNFGVDAEWGDGIWENDYVREGGVWKIAAAHLWVNFNVPFEAGWARAKPAPADWRSDVAKAFPPDRPPTRQYRPFPEPTLAPFHYRNPVTGREVQP